MSINVTVTGNPVNIKKGKMVCYDRNNCKKEFEKRRLMRLEQVRQQSKEIAEDVRKKVRKEKTKQLSQLEREGEEKLKKWQARKLLELQNQYKEAVKHIGLAHKEATLLPSDSDVLYDEKEKNDRVTKGRGHKAAARLQIERNEASYKQARPRQQRKLTREIENTRAALVSNLYKNGKSPFKIKKKRRRSADYAGGYCCDESDEESNVPKLAFQESDESSDCSSQCECELHEQLYIDDETETSDQIVEVVQKRNQPRPNSSVCQKRESEITKSRQLKNGNHRSVRDDVIGVPTRQHKNSKYLDDDNLFLKKEDINNFPIRDHTAVNAENLEDDHIFLTGENATRNSRRLGDKQIFLGGNDINNFQTKEREPVDIENLQDDQIFLTGENENKVQKKSSPTKKSRQLGDKQIFLGREDINNFQTKERKPDPENLQDDHIFLTSENGTKVQKKSSPTRKSRQLGDKQIFLGREDINDFQIRGQQGVYVENLQDDHIFLAGENGTKVQKKSSPSKKSRQLGDKQIFLERNDINDFQMKERQTVDAENLQDDQIFLSGENGSKVQKKSSPTRKYRQLGDKQIFLGREDVNDFQIQEQQAVDVENLQDDHIFLTGENGNIIQEKSKYTVKPQTISKGQQTSSAFMPMTSSENKSVQVFPRESFRTRLEIPVDTRISDRIRSRATIPDGIDLCDTFNTQVCKCNDFTRPPCYCGSRVDKPAAVDQATSYSEMRKTIDASGGNRHRDLHSISGQIKRTSQRQDRDGDDSSGHLQSRNEISTKPKVVLKPSKELFYQAPQTQSKINYYDHDNRFSKDYITDGSRVERISDEDLRVSPGGDSDVQYYDTVFKRDKDAQVRGQKALEKERRQREYKDLLKKLPALQRQERICEINNDKPEYHMSEERLLERERRRQNKMENAFEKAFPQRKPAVVTIPRKSHEATADVNLTPFKTGETADGSPILNLGEWDVEARFPKGGDVEPVLSDKERREQLKHLLESLQSQKKLLLEEIQRLPNDSSLHDLVAKFSNGEVENINIIQSPMWDKQKVSPKKAATARKARTRKEDTIQEDMEDADEESYDTENTKVSGTPRKVRPREKSKRRRSPVKPDSLNASAESNIDSHRSLSKEERYKKRHEKCFTSEAPASPSPSPRKKAKIKKYKKRPIILQNCGTQTAWLDTKKADKVSAKSEKVISDKNVKTDLKGTDVPKDTSQVEMPVSDIQHKSQHRPERVCSKSHVPCDCMTVQNADYPEDFCQIVIKIKDDKKPEITVNPPERNKNVEIITDENREHDVSKEHRRPKTPSEKHRRKEDKKNKAIEKNKLLAQQPSEPQEEFFKRPLTSENNEKFKPVPDPKVRSWREQLSKNSSGETTSTSYYSPPDFAKIRAELAQTAAGSTVTDPALPQTHPSNYDRLLKKKPQQRNFDASSYEASKSDKTLESHKVPKVLDPKLLTYIKKLITMSRENIHNLGVSTVSDVSTPSQSVIEMESNKPLNQLQNIMKYFNLSAADLRHHLSYSSNGSSAHFKTQENLTLSSSDGSQVYTQNLSSKHYTSSPKHASREDSSGHNVLQNTSDSSVNRNVKKYAEIAESCSQRISNLSAMIQQVREEKMKILQSPPGSDQDQSTKYMKLPATDCVCGAEKRDTKKTDSSESADEDSVKNILKIDYDLAEKLKKMSPGEIKQYEQNMYDQVNNDDEKSNISMSDSDRELFARLQNLLQKSGKVVRNAQNENTSLKQKSPSKDKFVAFNLEDPPNTSRPGSPKQPTNTSHVPFVPLLLDIPKLPKLTSNPLQPEVSETNHRRPPPSKGLTIAMRYNGDMAAVVPHELSTIAEADSQLSTKVDQSPSQKSNVNTPHKRIHVKKPDEKLSKETMVTSLDKSITSSSKSSNEEKPIVSVKQNTTPPKLSESDQSLIDMLNELNKSVHASSKSETSKSIDLSQKTAKHSSTSSDDKSDMETVEKMLHSIGMDWAVATLRKTKEALALSSSSSSVDLNAKASRSKSKSSKSSDISLREFLSQQLVAKISSSTLKSDTSTPSNNLLGESQELSAIQFSMEKQRTSTPIPSSSKSLDKSKSPQKIAFSGESEISTVNNNSREVKKDATFYSLSESPSSNS